MCTQLLITNYLFTYLLVKFIKAVLRDAFGLAK